MKIKCDQCGKMRHKKIGNYRYRESGLDNVYLENIHMYQCSCGISYPSILRLPRLNELIALTLLGKPVLLSGKEIRFLRKNLHLASKLFANKLGVGKTTLSKWENEVQNHSERNDRLIRAIYIIEKGIKRQDQLNIQKQLENILLKNLNTDYEIIAEEVQDDYVIRYRPLVESRAEQFSLIDEFTTWEYRSIATSIATIDTILPVAVSAKNRPMFAPQGLFFVDSYSSSISEGTKLYVAQATEI